VTFDSTLDVGHGGTSLDFNTTFALFGTMGESGLRARLTASGSWYSFLVDPVLATSGSGHALEGDFLLGYGLVIPRVSMMALVGPAIVKSVDVGVSRERNGVKTVFSLYARPTDDTMAYGQGIFSSINDSYQIQGKVGIKIPLGMYLGPEIKVAGQKGDTQKRFGIHLSGIHIGPLVVSLSGGEMNDQQLGSGQYVSVNVYASF